jgi:ribonuclease III
MANNIQQDFIKRMTIYYVPQMHIDNKFRINSFNLFIEAMTHNSFSSKKTYERLEFLGDAIFHLIITEYLYNRYTDEDEGFLTKLRIRIEKRDSMAELAQDIGLKKYIKIGSNVFISEDIMEDVFEAFIGAFYLNFGMNYTRLFIFSLIEKHKNITELIHYDDNFKDLLQRYFHQMKWGHPIYEEVRNNETNLKIIQIKNPDGKILGTGKSNTKKKASQIASSDALSFLKIVVDGELNEKWQDDIDKLSDKKDKTKKTTTVYNEKNILIDIDDINEILLKYNIVIPKKINIKLFREATTHRSYLKRKIISHKNINNAVELQKRSNEHLQFIGDTVIHFVVSELLYNKYYNMDEGFLTRMRCKIENRESLFDLSNAVGISEYILISHGIELMQQRNNVRIISGGLEAFIGAIYISIGLSISRTFIQEIIANEINIDEIVESETNYKEQIIQVFIKNKWGQPVYKTIKSEGPDHSKIFTIGIYLHEKLMGVGTEMSKKKAEQLASKNMIDKLNK